MRARSYCFIVRRFDGRMILRIEPQENIAAQFKEGRIAPGLAGLFRQRRGVVADPQRGLRIAGGQFQIRQQPQEPRSPIMAVLLLLVVQCATKHSEAGRRRPQIGESPPHAYFAVRQKLAQPMSSAEIDHPSSLRPGGFGVATNRAGKRRGQVDVDAGGNMTQRFRALYRRSLCGAPQLRVAGDPAGARTVAISATQRVHTKLETGVVIARFAQEVEPALVFGKSRLKLPKRERTPTESAMRSGDLCRPPAGLRGEQKGLRGLFGSCVPSLHEIDDPARVEIRKARLRFAGLLGGLLEAGESFLRLFGCVPFGEHRRLTEVGMQLHLLAGGQIGELPRLSASRTCPPWRSPCRDGRSPPGRPSAAEPGRPLFPTIRWRRSLSPASVK